jgi:hypothetical protein
VASRRWWRQRGGGGIGVGDLILFLFQLVGELLVHGAVRSSVTTIPPDVMYLAIKDLEKSHGAIRQLEMSTSLKLLHSEKSGYLSWQPIFDSQSRSIKKSVVRHLPESRARMLLKIKNKHIYQNEFSKT